MASRPAERPTRSANTHVTSNGTPKMVFETRAEADAYCEASYIGSMKVLYPYRCWMAPEHWHLTSKPQDPR